MKQRKAQGSSKSAEGKQVEEHNHNVVMLLQNKLADTSMSFKDVLEVRTQVRSAVLNPYCFNSNNYLKQNMKESKDRTEQFMYSAATAANQAPTSPLTLPISVPPELIRPVLDSFLFSSTQRQDPMADGSSGQPDAKGKGRATPNNGMLALDLESAEGGAGAPNGGGGAFQQMQLVEQQVRPLLCC